MRYTAFDTTLVFYPLRLRKKPGLLLYMVLPLEDTQHSNLTINDIINIAALERQLFVEKCAEKCTIMSRCGISRKRGSAVLHSQLSPLLSALATTSCEMDDKRLDNCQFSYRFFKMHSSSRRRGASALEVTSSCCYNHSPFSCFLEQ